MLDTKNFNSLRNFMHRDHEELRREIFSSMDEKINTVMVRYDAMDKASGVLVENVNRVPTLLDREVLRIKESMAQDVASILTRIEQLGRLMEVQFKERDVRADQDKAASTTAVNAALQAQKEAAGAQNVANAVSITKSENGFTKEIDGLKLLINSTRDGLTNQISDLTGRVTRYESNLAGGKEAISDTRLTIGSVVGILGGVVGVLSLIAVVIFGIVTSINRNANSISALVPLVQEHQLAVSPIK